MELRTRRTAERAIPRVATAILRELPRSAAKRECGACVSTLGALSEIRTDGALRRVNAQRGDGLRRRLFVA